MMWDRWKLLEEVFNARGLLLAFFGALGGAVRAATLKTTWREGMRVVFIGAATSFGVGAFAPVLLGPILGDLPQDAPGTMGSVCALAFLVGLLAVTRIERIIAKRLEEENDAQ